PLLGGRLPLGSTLLRGLLRVLDLSESGCGISISLSLGAVLRGLLAELRDVICIEGLSLRPLSLGALRGRLLSLCGVVGCGLGHVVPPGRMDPATRTGQPPLRGWSSWSRAPAAWTPRCP